MEPQGVVPELAAQVGSVLSVDIPHSSDNEVGMLDVQHQQTLVTVNVTESDSQTEPTIATITLPFQTSDPIAETSQSVQEIVKAVSAIST